MEAAHGTRIDPMADRQIVRGNTRPVKDKSR
jgi:hypothetical protein